jgi:hypothetical protein
MTVIPLPSATRIGNDFEPYARTSGWAEPRDFAPGATGLVHRATAPLLHALDVAVTAAGRTLADREHHVRQAS